MALFKKKKVHFKEVQELKYPSDISPEVGESCREIIHRVHSGAGFHCRRSV